MKRTFDLKGSFHDKKVPFDVITIVMKLRQYIIGNIRCLILKL